MASEFLHPIPEGPLGLGGDDVAAHLLALQRSLREVERAIMELAELVSDDPVAPRLKAELNRREEVLGEIRRIRQQLAGTAQAEADVHSVP